MTKVVPSYLYRNARSGELFEWFLIAAITALLLTRFYLEVTGYPSVGGASLHIAHMLPGGLLMVAGLILNMAFLGSRVQRLASVVAGVGFGLFIDEIGKFVTRDNNYFFQPAVALIYLLFVGLYLAFRSLNRHRHLSQTENLLNAVSMLEEVVIHNLDEPERKRVLQYLRGSDSQHPLVAPLQVALHSIKPIAGDALPWWRRAPRLIEQRYEQVIQSRLGTRIIEFVFVGKASLFLIVASVDVYELIVGNEVERIVTAAVLKYLASLVSAILIIIGVIKIRSSRAAAYEWFTKSLLVDIFITQFFSFYRLQFRALPGFIFNVALYIALRFLIRQEQRTSLRSSAQDPHSTT